MNSTRAFVRKQYSKATPHREGSNRIMPRKNCAEISLRSIVTSLLTLSTSVMALKRQGKEKTKSFQERFSKGTDLKFRSINRVSGRYRSHERVSLFR